VILFCCATARFYPPRKWIFRSATLPFSGKNRLSGNYAHSADSAGHDKHVGVE